MKRVIRNIVLAVAAVSTAATANAQQWLPDSLGREFVKRYVKLQPVDGNQQRCTIVRDTVVSNRFANRRAVLYIHGFNDYFFQRSMADRFAAEGYDFYAVDLQRYGRSLLPGDRPFDVRSLNEYAAPIDSAIAVIKRNGAENLTLMGHSTGGLIATYYLQTHPAAPINALILNSPFLDWNLGKIEFLVPLVSAVGAVFPNLEISQGSGTVYSQSLDSLFHGEWNFNRAWKMHHSPDVTAGWVRAIDRAQRYVRSHPDEIKIPILLMCSLNSYMGDEWTPEAQRADAVLDVNDIVREGVRLGPHVTLLRVKGGLHDLFLSAAPVRNALYSYVFDWLDRH